jgi:hypothetical protein
MGEINQELKSIIEGLTFLSRDMLHVYGGILFLLLWTLFFKNQKVYIGLILVFFMAIVNEYFDIEYNFKHKLEGKPFRHIQHRFYSLFNLP